MRRLNAALIIVALSGLYLGARAVQAQEPSAAGLWQQIDPESGKSDGWFYIYERNGTHEGAIVRMFLKPNDPPNPLCTQCKGDQQNAPWLGLTIIKGMARKGLEYDGGTILDPRKGNFWGAKMILSPDGQDLTVRGYALIPVLGMNQYWKRLPNCAYAQLDPGMIAKFKMAVPRTAANAPKEKSAGGC